MRKTIVILFMLLVSSSFLYSATFTSAKDGQWKKTDTWSPAGSPSEFDIVIVNHAVTLNGNDEKALELHINAGGSVIGNKKVSIYGLLYVDLEATLDVKDLELKAPISSCTIDGEVIVDKKFVAEGVAVVGVGSVDADEYDFNSGATLFGDPSPSDGNVYFGASHWDGGTSDWNLTSNWTNGVVPSLTEPALISNNGINPIITGSENAKSLTIRIGASLTIETGGSLTVVEGINNQAGNSGLILNSSGGSSGDGSLIFESGAPNATIHRHVESAGWHQVTPITISATANDFYIDGTDSWLATHSESTNDWDYITSLDQTLNRNQGYIYWIDGGIPNTVEFSGALTSDDQNPSLEFAGDEGDQGWNLLGNPYPSAIDWDQGAWGVNTEGTVYVWDNDYNGVGDYRSWNGLVGDLTDGIIPMGQGFFVKSTSAGNFTIPAAARVHATQDFYKSADDELTSTVRIQLEGDNFGNTVFVGFPEYGTDEFDFNGDASKLYSSKDRPQLFVVENNQKLCINANAPLTSEGKTVPLHITQVIDGDYTLALSQLDQLPKANITLEDLKTGTVQNLNDNPIYTFNANAGDVANRFLLHFELTSVGIEDDMQDEASFNIYSSNKTINVQPTNNSVAQNARVYVFDLMGREIINQPLEYYGLTKLTVNLSNAYAIVKVVNDGSVKTEKVFIK